jgi:8-oxoguanine deaminase
MATLLIKRAQVVATMNDAEQELTDASIFIRDRVIEAVGPSDTLPDTADRVIDARRHVVIPGLINTHHHMVQSLTKAVPVSQNAELFAWLKGCPHRWRWLSCY